MIDKLIYTLTQFKIPLYSLLGIIGIFLISSRFMDKKEGRVSKISIAFFTSMFTVLFICGISLAALTFPHTMGVNLYDIKKATQGIEEIAGSNYRNIESFFRREEVGFLSNRFFMQCERDIKCFKEKAYDYVTMKMDYINDDARFDGDKWLTPSQTIVMGGGDCEDQAFLLASILKNKINQTYVVEYEGHMAVGVCENKSLIRYDATKPSKTGEVINQTKVKKIANTHGRLDRVICQ